ncbi:MAG: alpha-2-macroglobulin family protein [bacterium]
MMERKFFYLWVISILICIFSFITSSHASITIDMVNRITNSQLNEKEKASLAANQEQVAALREKIVKATEPLRQEEWDKAITALDLLANDYPDSPIADLCTIEKGYALLKKGDKKKALKILEQYSRSSTHLAPLAEAIIAEINDQQIHLSGRLLYPPNQQVIIQVSSRNMAQIHCQLIKIDISKNAHDFIPFADPVIYEPLRTWKLKLEGDQSYRIGKIELNKLNVGTYVLEAGNGNIRRFHPFFITDLQISGYSLGEIKYLVARGPNGRPANGAGVTLIDWMGKPEHIALAKDGLAEIRSPWPVLAVVESEFGPGVLYLPSKFAEHKTGDRIVRCYTYTDRAVYRPGQRIQFRGIIRELRDRYLILPEEKEVEVSLKDSHNRLVAQIDQSLSKWGTFHGEFTLDERCISGNFAIETRLKPIPENNEQSCARTEFAVEAYRRPEITIDVLPKKDILKKDESLTVHVQSSYFHRAPVVGASLKWQVSGEGAKFITKGDYGHGVLTDKNGEANFIITTGLPKGRTNCQIKVSLQTPSRRTYEGYATITLVGTEELQTIKESEFLIESEDRPYFIGEECILKLRVPTDCSLVTLIVEAGKLDGVFSISCKEGNAEYLLPIKKEYLGGVTLYMESVSDSKRMIANHTVRVLPKNAAAQVMLNTDKISYHPADKAIIDITTVDREGGPVASEVALGMVDRALYTIAEETLTPIDSFFYPARPRKTYFSTPKDIITPMYYCDSLSFQTCQVSASNQTINKTPSLSPLEISAIPLEYLLPGIFRYSPVGQQPQLGPGGRQIRQVPNNMENSAFSLGYCQLDFYRQNASNNPFVWLFCLLKLPCMGAGASPIYLANQQQELQQGSQIRQIELLSISPTIKPKIIYQGRLRMGRRAGVTGNIRMSKGGGGYIHVQPFGSQARTFFPDLAAWHPSIQTNSNGKAKLNLTLPDTITSWRLTARCVTEASGFSETRHEICVQKDFFITCQRPRTLYEGDQTTISALIHSHIPTKGIVRLDATGLEIVDIQEQPFESDGKHIVRLDWTVRAIKPGFAHIELTDNRKQDFLIDKVQILPLGMHVTFSKTVIADQETVLNLPEDFNPKRWRVYGKWLPNTYQVVAMALSKLAEFPHGCVEQTMSRFMPDVFVADALKGGIEDRVLKKNLEQMVSKGAQTLYGYQNNDGGWGWFRENKSAPFMTAYVLWGLAMAGNLGYPVDARVIQRGRQSLFQLLKESKLPDAKAYMILALVTADKFLEEQRNDIITLMPEIKQLSAYGIALISLAYQLQGEDKAATDCTNRLIKMANRKDGQVYWSCPLESAEFLRADEVETTAYALRSIMLCGKDEKISSQAAAWLRLHCDATGWRNTKSTSAAVYGLAEFLRGKKGGDDDSKILLYINEKLVPQEMKEGMECILNIGFFKPGENYLTLKGSAIPKDGILLLVAEGWSGAKNIQAGGHLCGLTRHYRSFEEQGEIDIMSENDIKDSSSLPLTDGVLCGELAVAELIIKPSSELSYCVLEDPIPSGCEIVNMSWDPLNGLYPWRRRSMPYIYAEARDDRMLFYFRHLSPGEYKVTYRLRGESPGIYSIPSARIHEMYEPENMAHSSTCSFQVKP